MTGPLLYPGADHTTQWVGKGSVTMPMNNVKWVVHTTETAGGWPGYASMTEAPTLTYEPWQHKWRQHFEINQSARALRNDGTHYTNRCDVVQTEIACYCDHALAAKYGHSCTNLDQQALDDLGDFGSWLHHEWGMALDFYPTDVPWPIYPLGCPRMSWDRYATWSGVLGHMAVPGNTHLDPGDLPMDRIKARMVEGGDPWPAFRSTSAAVGAMVAKLAANGYFRDKHRDRPNYYGAWTRGAIRRLQEAQGWTGSDADGLIGPATWALIQALPDDPQGPPPGQRFGQLAVDWLRAAHAASLAGQRFRAAHKNMPAYGALVDQEIAIAAAIRKLT